MLYEPESVGLVEAQSGIWSAGASHVIILIEAPAEGSITVDWKDNCLI